MSKPGIVPTYLICLPLEGDPVVLQTPMSWSEEERLLEWLTHGSRKPWAALLKVAIELEDEQARAA